ncbi:hypothetical protein MCOR07_005944 [Pyricularia oryzae]|nr:hypothetical protein MCOR19_000792 [Pyricularia oryzae]KAI6285747.1 hypothetical protein MCOR26_001385 [Pyricularia oryzae]KAI6308822.1 hypothetical protein MCOR34_007075 [Pyricularia oryzae]KAI6341874.1 hypothetical protein MCOR28_005738 [Pyricularia oryzae]KAI6355151.1 hypothetical protein MCOR32_010353 [Pyricularia oryzae]
MHIDKPCGSRQRLHVSKWTFEYGLVAKLSVVAATVDQKPTDQVQVNPLVVLDDVADASMTFFGYHVQAAPMKAHERTTSILFQPREDSGKDAADVIGRDKISSENMFMSWAAVECWVVKLKLFPFIWFVDWRVEELCEFGASGQPAMDSM